VLVAVTAALIAAGLVLAFLMARAIARPIRALAASVSDGAAPPALGLREADEVGRVIAQSALELRESESRLRRILDSMFVFTGLLSLDGRVLEVNRAPLEAAGLAREEVIGQPCAEISWFSYCAAVQERLRAALGRAAAGEAVRYDETIRVRGGELMAIDLMFSPLRDASGRVAQIVGSAADITERKRASERLRELARRLMETEETERRKLNRELHDRVAANLSAASLGLNVVRSQLPAQDAAAARERLGALEKLLAETVRQARDLMAELSPPALEDYGLLAALQAHAEVLEARSGLEVSVSGSDPDPRPALAVETALFRIAQEALSNVLKHAGVSRAQIELAGARLTIRDAGRGFDPGAGAAAPSWGMRTMRERAEAIGASLSVESAPGSGTRVTVEL
jgi:PAS domain S-box-containing protein